MIFQNHVLAWLGAKTVLCMTLHREQREIEGESFFAVLDRYRFVVYGFRPREHSACADSVLAVESGLDGH